MLDEADILPASDEAALNQRLTQYWSKSGNALVVVSVTSLDGQSIDDYAFDLFNDWGIGDAATNRGLLLLVAPNQRKVRIEVGCGLEGRITNDVAASIIDDDILPEYRAGNLEAGTLAGVNALIEELAAPASSNDNNRTSPICKARANKAA